MKIAIVAQYYPPHVGGLEVVAKKQAESFAAAGHAVTVITCACADARVGDRDEQGVHLRRAAAANFLDQRLALPFALPGIGLFRKLRQEIMQADVVLLHDVFYPVCWLGYLLVTLYGKPLVLIQHVGYVEHPSRTVVFGQRLVYATFGAAIFRKATNLVVFNGKVKAFLLRCGVEQEKITELRNGVNLEQFQPPPPRLSRSYVREKFDLSLDKPIVLFVGRLVPKKGFKALLEAADESFQLVLVGSGIFAESYRHLSNIHFLGSLAHLALRELYSVSDLFVLPSVGEVFTVAMQEAMASGLPVITTDDAAYNSYDINRDLIALIRPDPPGIRDAILRLLADPERRARMSEYSRATAEEWFDWDKNFLALEKLVATAVRHGNETTPAGSPVLGLAESTK
jgi:glycosyltransferase involved in cell wall biosynthesis